MDHALMRLAALLFPVLAAATQAADPPITVVGYPWAPFISPMGEPFRPRPAGDDTLARWFHQADRNGDATLTPDEMQADADRFFARLDTNHDGEIDPEELVVYEWEVAPEIQLNSKWRQTRSQAGATRPAQNGDAREGRRPGTFAMAGLDDCLQGAARYSLLNLPQPVAAADTDFNRAITIGEFRQAALARFELLDRGRLGRLTLQALQPLVPPPPKRCRPKRDEKDIDTRIGVPLPPRD